MNFQKTDIEILHSAYHQLWQQMQTKRLFQHLHRSTEQAFHVKVKKPSHKHTIASL